MYQELRTHTRHNETLRSTVTNIMIVASAGLVSLSTYDQKVNNEDLPAAILLIGFGILGIMFSLAYTERYHRFNKRSGAYQDKLDELFFNGSDESAEYTLRKLKDKGDSNSKFKEIASIIRNISNSHILWIALPFFVSSIGVFLTIKALQNSLCPPLAP